MANSLLHIDESIFLCQNCLYILSRVNFCPKIGFTNRREIFFVANLPLHIVESIFLHQNCLYILSRVLFCLKFYRNAFSSLGPCRAYITNKLKRAMPFAIALSLSGLSFVFFVKHLCAFVVNLQRSASILHHPKFSSSVQGLAFFGLVVGYCFTRSKSFVQQALFFNSFGNQVIAHSLCPVFR